MLSFLTWGIGGFSLTLLSSNSIASVDSEEISVSEFQQFSRDIINRLGLNSLSNKDLINNGIYDLSLDSLINQKRFLLEAKELSINNDENVVKNIIRNDPIFKDKDGNFSLSVYRTLLANNRISEQDFVNDVIISYRSRLVVDSMLASFKSSPVFSNSIWNYQEQTRDAEIVTVPILNYDKEPTSEELNKYLQENLSKLQIPEKRSGKIAKINLKTFNKLVSVSDDETRQRYDSNLISIIIPKRRDVSVLIVTDKEKVKEALNISRKNGTLTKSKGQKLEVFDNINQKQLAAATLISDIATTAFDAKKAGILDPITTDFATYIIEVRNFKKEIVPPFSNYKDLLSKQILEEKASNLLYDTVGNVEDMISFNESFETILTSLPSVTPFIVKKGTFDNISVSLASVTNFDQLAITQTLFNLSTNSEKIKIVEGQNQDYYIVSLTSISPSKKADLNDKDDKLYVSRRWKYSKAVEKAVSIAKRVKNNFPNNRRIEYYNKLKRVDKDNTSGLSEALRQKLFTLKPRKTAVVVSDISVSVVRLARIRVTKQDKSWKKQLDKLYSETILDSYKFSLEKKYSSKRDENKFQNTIRP